MPINIYIESNHKNVAWICDEIWDLPTQISELEKWLEKESKNLPLEKYVADIGFNMRKEASGGGSVITSKMMKNMSEIEMDIYLSEYPDTKND